MNPYRYVFLAGHLAFHEGDVFFFIEAVAVVVQDEFAVFGGNPGLNFIFYACFH
jgi:hypothetical protein